MSRLVDSSDGTVCLPTRCWVVRDDASGAVHAEQAQVNAALERTPLRTVLVGEHCARALDRLMSLARPGATDDVMLDMSIADARVLVAFLDAYCDWLDSNGEEP